MATPPIQSKTAPEAARRGARRRGKVDVAANPRAEPTRMKQKALEGDMRPGWEASTVVPVSRKKNSSMPRFQPKKYSLRLSAPMAATRKAGTAALRRWGSPSWASRARERPERASPKAVLAFMVTRPGKTLLSGSIPNTQPIQTARPARSTPIPAPRTNVFGSWMNIAFLRASFGA